MPSTPRLTSLLSSGWPLRSPPSRSLDLPKTLAVIDVIHHDLSPAFRPVVHIIPIPYIRLENNCASYPSTHRDRTTRTFYHSLRYGTDYKSIERGEAREPRSE